MNPDAISENTSKALNKISKLIENNKLKAAKNQITPLIESRLHLDSTYYFLGLCQKKESNLREACDSFELAIKYNNKHEFAYGALANTLLEIDSVKNKQDAITLLGAEYNLHKRNDSLESLILLSNELKLWDALEQQSKLLLQSEPQNVIALAGLAIAMLEKGIAEVPINVELIEKSLNLFNIILKLKPKFWLAHKAFAKALSSLGEHEIAEKHYTKTFELNNLEFESLLSAGLCRISVGKIEGSWEMTQKMFTFGAKKFGMDRSSFSACPAPLWNGDIKAGKKILISSEQGIGDQLLFIQLAIELFQQGMDITMTCNPKLESVLKRSLPNISFYNNENPIPKAVLESMSYKATFFDVAQHLRPSMDSFYKAKAQKYLKPNPQLKQKIENKYQRLFQGKIRIGISWKSLTAEHATIKSTILEHWINILRLPNVQIINVQYGKCQEELEAVCNKYNIDIYQDDFNPYNDIEAAIAQLDCLDLLISVSNSSVHMAGQLGIPTFVLLPVSPLWHWFREGESSVWYDSVRLFRQELPGVWSTVLEELEEKTKHFLLEKQSAVTH